MTISKLIIQGENETTEFKQSFDKDVLETVGAFANRKGGNILIGITDKGEIKGISVGKESLKEWANQIAQVTDPKILVEISGHKIKGKSVVVIKVHTSKVKPISVNGRYYLRVANSNRNLTLQKINEIYMDSIGLSWDMTKAIKATMKDLNLKKIKLYMERSISAKRRRFSEAPIQVLEKLGLKVDSKPTWAAVLLFGTDPTMYIPHARVHCGRIKGDATIIDDNYIEGDLFDQIDKTMSVIQRNISVQYVISGKRAQRDEIWEYPLDALREVVVNAICHRDYADNNEILIKIYDDSISIWNPGGLPPDMSFELFTNPNHPSRPRNKSIAQALYDVADIEKYGSGVRRILEACRTANIPPPVFEEQAGGFHVLFRKSETKTNVVYEPSPAYARNNSVHLNDRQKKAIDFVKANGKINNTVYQSLYTVSRRTATRELIQLVQLHIFEKSGSRGRGTEYRLIAP